MDNRNLSSLILIQQGFKDIPESIFTPEDKDYLVAEGLIQLVDEGWILTGLGKAWLEAYSKDYLHYEKLYNYDHDVSRMSDAAVNALVCATINSDKGFYSRLDTKVLRTFMQHLYNIKINRRMGKSLIQKWHKVLSDSLNYFTNGKNKENPRTKGGGYS